MQMKLRELKKVAPSGCDAYAVVFSNVRTWIEATKLNLAAGNFGTVERWLMAYVLLNKHMHMQYKQIQGVLGVRPNPSFLAS